MNALVRDFYHTTAKEGEPVFHSVLFLSECKKSWEEVKTKCACLPRGWYELCQLPAEDRIIFTRDYWIDRLPYHPVFCAFLSSFFARLDDVGAVLCQESPSAPWRAEMVYSLKGDQSFFRGRPPCDEEDLDALKAHLSIPLPRDYLAFLEIHNGFGKLSEMGLLGAKELITTKQRLLDAWLSNDRALTQGGRLVDPSLLIPFFSFFGTESYQCFYADWYPGNEMGNVYLSGIDYTVSDCSDRNEWSDQLAFPTFLDWMAFYMEGKAQER